MNTQVRQIIQFWFLDPNKWYAKDWQFDQQIRDNFLIDYENAIAHNYVSWQQTAEGCLALILLLDQFSRNMFRDTAKMYATDAQAIMIAKEAISKKFDQALSAEQRQFIYMPFMHSEDLEDQEISLKLFKALGNANGIKYAQSHYDIVAEFDRYPHRNKILGRKSTDAELVFLKKHSGF